ncbi:MAG: hypothetical protein CM1200mP13_06430 [Candidatus Pelagibacterales bacterium]|nr:MAG: hypothetical protein CM1200mP13_06430 [Pelagibacterales bacterium]
MVKIIEYRISLIILNPAKEKPRLIKTAGNAIFEIGSKKIFKEFGKGFQDNLVKFQ